MNIRIHIFLSVGTGNVLVKRVLLTILMSARLTKGGGTGPAGPVLAGPLFQRASKTFEQTKKQMHGKQILILATRT